MTFLVTGAALGLAEAMGSIDLGDGLAGTALGVLAGLVTAWATRNRRKLTIVQRKHRVD